MPRRRTNATTKKKGQVVDISEALVLRRIAAYRERLDRALRANRRAVGRLYTTGRLFSRHGLRAGRDLLVAHEHLLRVVTLLDRLAHDGDVPAPREKSAIEDIFAELDTLLGRTAELTRQTVGLMDELKQE